MECLSPRSIKHTHETRRGPVTVNYTVPCGKCVFCSVSRRSEWAVRLHYEGRKHYCKQFITLTYQEKFCPDKVRKYHLQNFFKRLRKAGCVFKYYAVGEYGAETQRPHYHILMFGEVPRKAIEQAWSFYSRKTKKFTPIGIVHIGSVTESSVMYCLGYTVHGAKKGNKRPFTLMSKGLGKSYLTPAMIAWHKSGWKNYTMIYEKKVKLPRYFKRKIFTPREMMWIRQRETKESWERDVARIRKLAKTRIKDPIAYMQEQKLRYATRLRMKSKELLII